MFDCAKVADGCGPANLLRHAHEDQELWTRPGLDNEERNKIAFEEAFDQYRNIETSITRCDLEHRMCEIWKGSNMVQGSTTKTNRFVRPDVFVHQRPKEGEIDLQFVYRRDVGNVPLPLPGKQVATTTVFKVLFNRKFQRLDELFLPPYFSTQRMTESTRFEHPWTVSESDHWRRKNKSSWVKKMLKDSEGRNPLNSMYLFSGYSIRDPY